MADLVLQCGVCLCHPILTTNAFVCPVAGFSLSVLIMRCKNACVFCIVIGQENKTTLLTYNVDPPHTVLFSSAYAYSVGPYLDS